MNTLYLGSRRSVLVAFALFTSMLLSHAAGAQSIPAATGISQGASVTAPAAVDIRDIRGPKPIASPWMIALVAMTVLLAVGGSYGAWVWNSRRFRDAPKGPLGVALDRLQQARALMQPPTAREFSIEVSSTVRDYIESRFDIRAAHLTTDEFLRQLLEPRGSLLVAHRPLLDNFLQTCDLAKFGGWNLAGPDMENMLQSARRFVTESAKDAASDRAESAATSVMAQPPTSASRETYASLPST